MELSGLVGHGLLNGQDVVQTANVGDKPSARLEPLQGGSCDLADCTSGSTDKNRVWIGQRFPRIRCSPQHGLHCVLDLEATHILDQQRLVLRVHLNRKNGSLVSDLCGLDGHRPAPGTHIPNDACRSEIQFRQGNDTHFHRRE